MPFNNTQNAMLIEKIFIFATFEKLDNIRKDTMALFLDAMPVASESLIFIETKIKWLLYTLHSHWVMIETVTQLN